MPGTDLLKYSTLRISLFILHSNSTSRYHCRSSSMKGKLRCRKSNFPYKWNIQDLNPSCLNTYSLCWPTQSSLFSSDFYIALKFVHFSPSVLLLTQFIFFCLDLCLDPLQFLLHHTQKNFYKIQYIYDIFLNTFKWFPYP